MIQQETKKRLLLILVIVLVSGLIRVPIENLLRREMNEAKMLNPPLEAGTLTQMGSSAIFGTLGGLRSMLATYFVLVAHDHFTYDRWDENRKAYRFATFLEPTEETHWVSLVWHRGVNATAWAANRSNLPRFQQDLLSDEYANDSIELGKIGLQSIPEAIELRRQMADIYYSKLKDNCGAAEMYRQMIGLPNSPSYVERFYCYRLADCPGEEQKAYDRLLELYYEGSHNHLPTLIVKLLELEKKLNVPAPLWIPERAPETEQERNRFRQRGRVPRRIQLPGGVSF